MQQIKEIDLEIAADSEDSVAKQALRGAAPL